jgi:hypothetical protein
MSEIKIKRRVRSFPITLHSTTSLATTLRMEDYAGGALSLPAFSQAATTASDLRVFGSESDTGTFRRVYGADGEAADIKLSPSSTEARIYNLPDAAFAVPYVKILSGGTTSTGTSGVVMFKS